ncbi:SDR family NAD(P)-dependent oxidoreductase [Haliangium ochraceum]|uniref:Short-chain dehydrogenase/reductase SDR n=1 Tax=Haliangium ochraceum (strain DSM 14365 / JCM 11303 / SMP-2) TaxID=502025 RepID=D0LTV8_HALO1|nr:SDR family oxidoreductase [Haliangium ochraceum]ACY15802.1 short-chain dehydrogenase/reductase SDR [Haliangium ochraceum DSM 14365]
MPDLRQHHALVTGASSGIGREIARLLASWGCALTLTARRDDRLRELARELGPSGVEVRWVCCDLAAPEGARALFEDVERSGQRVDILVNNAGFGRYQRFEDIPWGEHAAMLQLNVTALVELTHRFLPAMLLSERPAYVLNVASIAAYQPVPFFAAYAASKSFVRDFSEALAVELADTNLRVSCLCPGGTHTEFAEHSGQQLGRLAQASMLDAREVAERGLRAMLRGRPCVVTGWMNVLSTFLMRFLPRRAAAAGSVAVLGLPPDESGPDETR